MNNQTHIVQCDDPKYLPFARSCIARMRATGLRHLSQKFEVGGVTIGVRLDGEHAYVSIVGGTSSMAMDSGIIDVGAVFPTLDHEERFLAGERKFTPTYESSFSKQISTTPWYLNPSVSNTGQLAGTVSVGSRIVGKVRKDDVAESFTPQTTGTDDEGNRVANESDEALLAKKTAGVYCPASVFTGRARLYVQAMYGQPLYKRKTGDREDVAIPTPLARITGGSPHLVLVAYDDPNAERTRAYRDKVDVDRAAHLASGSLLPFPDPYSVTLNTSSGVYLDRSSRQHWLINPGYGLVTIYPLKASVAGEASRGWLRDGKLPLDDFERMEAYILSTCRPHVEVAETFTIPEIVPWASGYGWHWNWSGTTADMVRVVPSPTLTDGSVESTHYRLTATAVFDPDKKTTTWSTDASGVSGPHTWAMTTPVCCVTHPNWTNRYVGSEPDHPPVFWSEKITINHKSTPGGAAASPTAPIYAFYKKDDLQIVLYTRVRIDAQPPSLFFSEHYATYPASDPYHFSTGYVFQGLSWAGELPSLRRSSGMSASVTFNLTCGGQSAVVKTGGDDNGNTIEDGPKTLLTMLPAVDSTTGFFGPSPVVLNYGRPKEDGTYEAERPTTGPDGGYSYQAYSRYSDSRLTRKYASFSTTNLGKAGGVIPFYDAEAFYLFQDTWAEKVETERHEHVVVGNWQGHDAGVIYNLVLGAYDVQYHGWSTYQILAAPHTTESQVSEPDETTIYGEARFLASVSSVGDKYIDGLPPGSTYAMFENGHTDFIGETFSTICSAGPGELFRGLTEQNWPDMPGLQNPVIVGWI